MSEIVPTSINFVQSGIQEIPQSNYVHFIRESRICRYTHGIIICNYFGKLSDLFSYSVQFSISHTIVSLPNCSIESYVIIAGYFYSIFFQHSFLYFQSPHLSVPKIVINFKKQKKNIYRDFFFAVLINLE